MDELHGVIVAAELTNVAPDEGHLPAPGARVRALRAQGARAADPPSAVSADAASFGRGDSAQDGGGRDPLIAAGRDDPAAPPTAATGVCPIDRFADDGARGEWVRPTAKRLARRVTPPGARGRPSTNRDRADPADCAACPLRRRCPQPDEHQRLPVARRGRATGAMRFKMRQPAARRRYARRKAIVEPVFGPVKEDRGFATLSLRGPALAEAEDRLACLAHKLGKLLRVCPLRPRPVGA